MKLIKDEIESHIKKWDVNIFIFGDTFSMVQKFDEFIEMYKDIKLPFWGTRIETIIMKI